MRRRPCLFCCCLLLAALALPASSLAQEEADPYDGAADDGGGMPPEAETGAAPASDEALQTTAADVAPTTPVLTTGRRVESRRTWKDIVTVPRKPFIKRGRISLMPYWGTTVNDNLIQHFSLGVEANYYLTDILSIGIQGMAFVKNVLDQEFFTRYHFGRIPSLNKYRYHASLNFAYVPVYGKFALFNRHIIHFEVFATAGVGGTGTEIVPRDYNYAVFTNPFSLTFPVGLGVRAFVTRWIAIELAFRDYMMLDKFEKARGKSPDPAEEVAIAKKEAASRFVNNMMFNVGVSFYFPTDFKYTTFR